MTLPRPWSRWIGPLTVVLLFAPALHAETPGPAHAMLTLLKSGRIAPERLPTVVKMVCSRGNAEELTEIFSRATDTSLWDAELRAQTLGWLLEAARTRKVIPSGDLTALISLFDAADLRLQTAAIELAGEWQLSAAAEPLRERALDEAAKLPDRRRALAALLRISPESTMQQLNELSAPSQPFAVRSLAVSLLSGVDLDSAAAQATAVLSTAEPSDDLGELLEAFLAMEGGTERLASRLQQAPPSEDVAKRLLREMYARGRSDSALNTLLSQAAGIGDDPPPLTPEEFAALIEEVAARGNPDRGEAVFRREDLSCLRCHAISGAGGDVGPDLSAVGVSSPVDYLLTSVLDPDQAIKEAFITQLVLTVEGRIHQGIVISRTNDQLTLRGSTGELISIPVDDIDAEREGQSLMPKGLVKFMTREELVDLVAFLSALGKPGPFAVRSTPRLQRYQMLQEMPQDWAEIVPAGDALLEMRLQPQSWQTVIARVNGDLPLDELSSRSGAEVLYLAAEVQTLTPGAAEILLDSPDGVNLWWEEQPLQISGRIPVTLSQGRQTLLLRIDRSARSRDRIRIEFNRPSGSPAEFTVVDR